MGAGTALGTAFPSSKRPRALSVEFIGAVVDNFDGFTFFTCIGRAGNCECGSKAADCKAGSGIAMSMAFAPDFILSFSSLLGEVEECGLE